MNGPIAQLVALVCHANAFLRSPASSVAFFPGNSTCKFCDSITFVETKRSWTGTMRESVIAATADKWFAHLARKQALAVRLVHETKNDPRISDRMSAGFVGGGGSWMLAVRYLASTEYWMARWQVWNQKAPEQRIWRVTYGLVARAQEAPNAAPPMNTVREEFRSALVRIHAFSQTHECAGFTECFSRALRSLDNES